MRTEFVSYDPKTRTISRSHYDLDQHPQSVRQRRADLKLIEGGAARRQRGSGRTEPRRRNPIHAGSEPFYRLKRLVRRIPLTMDTLIIGLCILGFIFVFVINKLSDHKMEQNYAPIGTVQTGEVASTPIPEPAPVPPTPAELAASYWSADGLAFDLVGFVTSLGATQAAELSEGEGGLSARFVCEDGQELFVALYGADESACSTLYLDYGEHRTIYQATLAPRHADERPMVEVGSYWFDETVLDRFIDLVVAAQEDTDPLAGFGVPYVEYRVHD